jgi:hypothetical protein
MLYIRTLSDMLYLMKNFKLGIVLLMIICVKDIHAQPTLAAYNSNPVAPTQFTCIGINYITPANVSGFTVWNFISLVPKDTFLISYSNHGEFPADSIFPASDITRKIRNTFEYLITTTNGVSLAGYTDSLTYLYSENAELIRYPFTYQNQYTDNYYGKYKRKNDTINRSGSVAVSAPAYGNVKLPYATINNVLCIKTIETFNDFTKSGNEYHEITTYAWHVPGISSPIICFRSENFNGNFKESGFYLTKESLGVADKLNTAFDVSLINSSEHKLPQLIINASNSVKITISCVNLTGQEVFIPMTSELKAGQNKVELPDQTVLPALYLMIFRSADYQIIKKFVVPD